MACRIHISIDAPPNSMIRAVRVYWNEHSNHIYVTYGRKQNIMTLSTIKSWCVINY